MISLETKVTIPDTLFLQSVDDDTILLDINTQEYFSLNKVGTTIWDIMSKVNNLKEVKKEILKMYEVDEKQVESDILSFVEALDEKKLILTD